MVEMERDWWLCATGSDILTYLWCLKFLEIENHAQLIRSLSDMQATWMTGYEYHRGYYRRGRVIFRVMHQLR